jgi:hypothetical protein
VVKETAVARSYYWMINDLDVVVIVLKDRGVDTHHSLILH